MEDKIEEILLDFIMWESQANSFVTIEDAKKTVESYLKFLHATK